MLMALALLAAIDAVPSSTVSLILSGETDRPPVSAARRSLSDVARELRAGRKAVGSFSAAETTLPQSRIVFVPMIAPELERQEPEPEVVPEARPVYVPTYLPTWFGGGQKIARRHHHHRAAAHTATPRPGPANRLSGPPPFHPRHGGSGFFRER